MMLERKFIICIFVVILCLHHVTAAKLERSRDSYRRRPIRLPVGRSCSASSDCGGSGNSWIPSCCRDDNGSLVDAVRGSDLIIRDPTQSGRCSFRKGGPGEVCNNVCGCVRGYECYRTITGACCPPLTCWKAEDAQKDRDFWANCKPPTCFFPPSAPPSGPLL